MAEKKPMLRLPDGSEVVWYSPEYVGVVLEEAGRALMMLPATGLWPAGYKSNWPDIARLVEEAYGWTEVEPPRLKPTMAQMDNLDRVIRWIPMVSDIGFRQIIRLRMLVSPRTDRHCVSWRRCGEIMGIDHKTAQALHKNALRHLADKLNLND